MIRFKDGVYIATLSPQMAIAAGIIDEIYALHGFEECWITSGDDGVHSLGSKHYIGNALDFRTRDIPEDLRANVAADAGRILGENYDVVLEGTHLHVEYDPPRR